MQELSKDLSSNPHQLPAKVILIQRIGFSKKKKIIMYKSSSLLLYFHEKIQDFQIFQKKIQKSKFSIPWKNSRFQIFQKKKKEKFFQNFQFLRKIQVFQIQKKKKIFIKFFFINRKLWSSSTFSSDVTSSQLSTLSIHQSMEYVPN